MNGLQIDEVVITQRHVEALTRTTREERMNSSSMNLCQSDTCFYTCNTTFYTGELEVDSETADYCAVVLLLM